MPKFSITKLEIARTNPALFASQLKNAADGGGFPVKSRFVDWQRSIYHYHNTQDHNQAISYLTNAFKSHFKDTPKNDLLLEEHIVKLQCYLNDLKKKGLVFNDKNRKLVLPLTSRLEMTGLIPMIYLDLNGGYAAYFFQKTEDYWQEKLKFPILQNYIASQIYGCTNAQIRVGVYAFEAEEHFSKCFTDTEVNDALTELNDLGTTISGLL